MIVQRDIGNASRKTHPTSGARRRDGGEILGGFCAHLDIVLRRDLGVGAKGGAGGIADDERAQTAARSACAASDGAEELRRIKIAGARDHQGLQGSCPVGQPLVDQRARADGCGGDRREDGNLHGHGEPGDPHACGHSPRLQALRARRIHDDAPRRASHRESGALLQQQLAGGVGDLGLRDRTINRRAGCPQTIDAGLAVTRAIVHELRAVARRIVEGVAKAERRHIGGAVNRSDRGRGQHIHADRGARPQADAQPCGAQPQRILIGGVSQNPSVS